MILVFSAFSEEQKPFPRLSRVGCVTMGEFGLLVAEIS